MSSIGRYLNGSPGAADGDLITSESPGVVGDLAPAGTEVVSSPVRVCARVIPSGFRRDGNLTVEVVGAEADRWQLAPDVSGGPGSWEAWGASLTLTLSSLANANVPFWMRARATPDEAVAVSTDDLTVVLRTPDNVVAAVGQSWSLPYVIALSSFVGRSWVMNYTILNTVGRSWTLPYTVINTVGRSWNLPYTINTSVPVGQSWSLPYSILAPTITEAGTTSSGPMDCIMGPDGRAWFNYNSTAGKVGACNASGTITDYTLATNFIGTGICTDGTDIFVAGYISGGTYEIYKVTTGGTVTRIYQDVLGYGTYSIVIGSDGNLWATAPFYTANGGVTRMTKAGASATHFGFSESGATPQYIASDGTNLWVTLYGVQKVAKITNLSTGAYTAYSTTNANPYRIVYHAAEAKIFITVSGGLQAVTPSSGAMGSVITGTGAGFMAEGPDGQLWCGPAAGTVIRKLVIASGSVFSYTTPSAVWGVAGDLANGRLFYAAGGANKIGKVVL